MIDFPDISLLGHEDLDCHLIKEMELNMSEAKILDPH